MTKYTFINSIKAIKKQLEKDLKNAKLLSQIYPENYEPNLVYNNQILQKALINVLKSEMNDKDNFIEHFIWELDFGRKAKDLPITTNKSKKYYLESSESLYNFLREYY